MINTWLGNTLIVLVESSYQAWVDEHGAYNFHGLFFFSTNKKSPFFFVFYNGRIGALDFLNGLRMAFMVLPSLSWYKTEILLSSCDLQIIGLFIYFYSLPKLYEVQSYSRSTKQRALHPFTLALSTM